MPASGMRPDGLAWAASLPTHSRKSFPESPTIHSCFPLPLVKSVEPSSIGFLTLSTFGYQTRTSSYWRFTAGRIRAHGSNGPRTRSYPSDCLSAALQLNSPQCIRNSSAKSRAPRESGRFGSASRRFRLRQRASTKTLSLCPLRSRDRATARPPARPCAGRPPAIQ